VKYQVVEKDDFGTDWQPVRYEAYAMGRFNTEAEAFTAAVKYLNSINVDNVFTSDEKARNFEAYMVTEDGILLGVLDGKKWYLKYAKDTKDKKTGQVVPKGGIIKDDKYYELDGKTRVAVMPVRGT
jgi:hypothetical protein